MYIMFFCLCIGYEDSIWTVLFFRAWLSLLRVAAPVFYIMAESVLFFGFLFFSFFFCYLLVVQFVLLPLLVDLFCVAWRFGWVWILTQISVYILCAADGYFIVFYNCFMFISYFFFLFVFIYLTTLQGCLVVATIERFTGCGVLPKIRQ